MSKRLKYTAQTYLYAIAKTYQTENIPARAVSSSRGARHLSINMRLNDGTQLHKAERLAEAIALTARVDGVLPHRHRGLLAYQFELPSQYWQSYTRNDVKGLAIGLAEQRQPVRLDFSEPHTLIAGTTGSGKSEAVKSALVALMAEHTPADMGLVIIDPNFDYEDFNRAAHLVLPIATDSTATDNALQWLHGELKHRKAGNIRDGKRIVAVIDEAQSVLNEDARLAIVQDIASQARKYRINLVLSTQKPTAKKFPDLLDKFANRFVGMVTDARLSALLTGHPGLNAHRLTGKGDFLHVKNADATRFQIAQATPSHIADLPRADIAPHPAARYADFSPLPEPTQTAPGRPSIEIEADTLAIYLAAMARGEDVSHRGAGAMGISRTRHELHKPFAQNVLGYLSTLNTTLKALPSEVR